LLIFDGIVEDGASLSFGEVKGIGEGLSDRLLTDGEGLHFRNLQGLDLEGCGASFETVRRGNPWERFADQREGCR